MLIAFEGIDNAGKTTVFTHLFEILDPERFVFCSEFDSPIADQVKTLLKCDASDFLKTYFFAADRAWTYEKIAKPALESGRIVIWDRYVGSAIAYRTASKIMGNPVDLDLVRSINAPFGLPDYTFYFEISVELSLQRGGSSNKPTPYTKELLSMVKSFYDGMAASNSSYRKIDASISCDKLINNVKNMIDNIVNN